MTTGFKVVKDSRIRVEEIIELGPLNPGTLESIILNKRSAAWNN
jgi:hypothetical protein